MDFSEDSGVMASMFVFMGRIVLGYIWPIFFMTMAMSGSSKQKDESYADYQIRSAVNLAERLALTAAAVFCINKLVNGRRMRDNYMSKEEAEMWEEEKRYGAEHSTKKQLKASEYAGDGNPKLRYAKSGHGDSHINF
jgi:hypothetical protein